jgi:hypothetical protein
VKCRACAALLITAAVLLLLSSCDPFSHQPEGDLHALIFSSSYEGTNAELKNTIPDGDDMAIAFSAYGYRSRGKASAINDTDPTRTYLLDRIEDASLVATADDTTLFYYSGHGGYDPDQGESFLVTSQSSDYALYASELLEALHGVPGRKIVILDICNSGGFVSSRGYDVDGLPENYYSTSDRSPFTESWERYFTSEDLSAGVYDDMIVVSAAGEDEQSLESDSYGNGIFTYYFLESIGFDHETLEVHDRPRADFNSDDLITISEAYGSTFDLFEEHVFTNRFIINYYPHISGGPADTVMLQLQR